jgi:DNA mismatch repair ATPase MutS
MTVSRPSSSRQISSRPISSRPQTSTSTTNSVVVLAISESRGPQTTLGMASLNLGSGEVKVLQFNDTANFSLTLQQLFALNPSQVTVTLNLDNIVFDDYSKRATL